MDCDDNRDRDDSALWLRSMDGDATAFGTLFERHARTIYNYCFRRTGDWAAAEDLVSVVFLEAWRRRSKDLPPGKVLPWLYGIATNVVRSRRRAQRRYAAALRTVPEPEAQFGFADDVHERIDAERRIRYVLRSVRNLPRGDQEVIALCIWSELSYEDAALALGLPIGTVRSRLSRACERLREIDRSREARRFDPALITTEVLKP